MNSGHKISFCHYTFHDFIIFTLTAKLISNLPVFEYWKDEGLTNFKFENIPGNWNFEASPYYLFFLKTSRKIKQHEVQKK